MQKIFYILFLSFLQISCLNAKPTQQQQNTPTEYKVKNGDTLFSIARIYHISIKTIMDLNNLKMDDNIKVGQTLKISANSSTATKHKSPQTRSIETKTKQTKSSKTSNAPTQTYTVQSGDTLFSIARKNHIVISNLMELNHIKLGQSIKVGTVLRLSKNSSYIAGVKTDKKADSKPAKETTAPGAMPSYTVKKGDTLWRIAIKYHLSLAEIRKLNKMHQDDRIHAGMMLAVGRAAPVQPHKHATTPAKPKTYKVKKGDTLWLIAKKNHLTTKQLRKYNHMRRKDQIHTGMVLALSKGTKKPKIHLNAKTKKRYIARLRKKGAKKREINAVLAMIEEKHLKHPNLGKLLSQAKRKKGKSSRYASASSALNSNKHTWSSSSKIIRTAKRYLGRRYVWGAVGPRSFDCSGFTQYVMRKSKGVRIPRVSRKQAYYGKYISRSHLKPGDLIFFDTSHRRRGYVNHVGIYIGNNKFIHASSARHRVVITSLNRPFYRARFKWGRRIN